MYMAVGASVNIQQEAQSLAFVVIMPLLLGFVFSFTVLASPDLVDPDLTNLADTLPPEERYSYVFDGSAQAFDHVLVSSTLLPLARGLHYGRANADFPTVYYADPSRPERFSDHDAPVATFRSRRPTSRSPCPGRRPAGRRIRPRGRSGRQTTALTRRRRWR
jgi:hypothetical protein